MRRFCLVCGLASQMALLVPAAGHALDLSDPLGSRFTGTVTVQALPPDGDDMLHHASGEGVTTLFPTQDGVLGLQGSAQIDGQSAMRFDYDLHEQVDGSWLDESDDARMEITPSGTITVSSSDGETNIEGHGTISEAEFHLQLRILATATQPEMIFDLDLTKGGQSSEPTQALDCAQTVWQQRFIANPYGSTMSTVMVPVCIPAR